MGLSGVLLSKPFRVVQQTRDKDIDLRLPKLAIGSGRVNFGLAL